MIPRSMIVTKHIKEGRKVLAEVGTELSVVVDYNRLGGVHVLRKKGGRYICDYGSLTEKECCRKIS
jgi:hypothetical protein